MGRGSRCHPPSRASRIIHSIHQVGTATAVPTYFFIPIHIKPQGQKPPAAHVTPPITSHNIFINPQNLRLIHRKPTITTKFYSHKFYSHKISNVFLKSTSQRVNRSTGQQVNEFLGTNEMGHHISFSDKPIWRTFFPLNKWRCISATFSAKRWGLYLSGLRFTS